MNEEPVTFRVLIEEYDDAQIEACPRCGQALDLCDLTQVLHHRLPDHAPLTAAEA